MLLLPINGKLLDVYIQYVNKRTRYPII